MPFRIRRKASANYFQVEPFTGAYYLLALDLFRVFRSFVYDTNG
jgi:hypothetical protein